MRLKKTAFAVSMTGVLTFGVLVPQATAAEQISLGQPGCKEAVAEISGLRDAIDVYNAAGGKEIDRQNLVNQLPEACNPTSTPSLGAEDIVIPGGCAAMVPGQELRDRVDVFNAVLSVNRSKTDRAKLQAEVDKACATPSKAVEDVVIPGGCNLENLKKDKDANGLTLRDRVDVFNAVPKENRSESERVKLQNEVNSACAGTSTPDASDVADITGLGAECYEKLDNTPGQNGLNVHEEIDVFNAVPMENRTKEQRDNLLNRVKQICGTPEADNGSSIGSLLGVILPAALIIGGITWWLNHDGKTYVKDSSRVNQAPTAEEKKASEEMLNNNTAEVKKQAEAQKTAEAKPAAARGMLAQTGSNTAVRIALAVALLAMIAAAAVAARRRFNS